MSVHKRFTYLHVAISVWVQVQHEDGKGQCHVRTKLTIHSSLHLKTTTQTQSYLAYPSEYLSRAHRFVFLQLWGPAKMPSLCHNVHTNMLLSYNLCAQKYIDTGTHLLVRGILIDITYSPQVNWNLTNRCWVLKGCSFNLCWVPQALTQRDQWFEREREREKAKQDGSQSKRR